MTLQSGALLQNRYRIEGLLGRGGMGAVYRAIDTRLGNVVAIKQNLLESNAMAEQGTDHDEEWSDLRRAQFEREARLLASLRHHGLAKVTDYFYIDGEGQYLVMEFVEGQDFSTILKQMGPLHEDQAIGFIVDVCEVLDYLHSQAPPVIHRDIKPANIRLSPRGQVVLVDFGVAKVGTSDYTTIGARAVTPGFSPLEQFGGDLRTDERSDVYSLGATLCALLTGKAPTAATERLMDSTRKSPVEEAASSLTPALKAVLARSLELKPEDRYQSAREFRSALAALLSDGMVKASPYDRATLVDKVTMLRPAATLQTKRASEPASAGTPASGPPPSGPPATGAPTAAAPPPPPAPLQATEKMMTTGPAAPAPAPTGDWNQPTVARPRSGPPVWLWPVLGTLIALASIYFVFGRKGSKPSTVAPPAAVVLNSTPQSTANSVFLLWSPSGDPNFREYEIYCGTAPGFPITPARKYSESITNITNSRAEVTGLECDTGYYFKVRVVTNSGGSAVSEEVSARTAACGSDDVPPPEDVATNEPQSKPETGTNVGGASTDRPAPAHIDPAPVPNPGGSRPRTDPIPSPVTTNPGTPSSVTPPAPLPMTPPPVKPPPIQTLPVEITVAPSGGTFSTVGEAMAAMYAATDGVSRTVVIRPGRYVLTERITLGRGVQIRGQGDRAGIILEASTAQAIFVEGSGGVVRGLTIRTGSSSAVSVAGDAVFEDCEISAAAQSGVGVYGRGSVVLRRCRLSGSGAKGIFVFEGGRATLDGCTIESNKGGVEARDQASITLSNCDIRGNTGSGVYAHDGGTANINNCRITGNTMNGILLKAGTASISNCTVSQNAQFGLSCSGSASAITVANSDFSGNTLQGIQPTCTITRSGTIKE